jgi:hypothetical protein
MINPGDPGGPVTGLSAVKLHGTIRMIRTLYETIAKLAGFDNRQHICSTLNSEFNTKSHKVAQAASSRYESGKPVIITDFLLLPKKPVAGLGARRLAGRNRASGLLARGEFLAETSSLLVFNSFIQISSSSKGTNFQWITFFFHFGSMTWQLFNPASGYRV